MYHHVARTRTGLLFESWEEAAQLWDRVLRACPGAVAVCLMPNHIHVQHPRDVRVALARSLGRYVAWLNRKRGRRGSLLPPLPAPTWTSDARKRRRETRYIELNPCRAGLVADPPSWPWSSYRDRLGLSLRSGLRPVHDPESVHAYTSADHSVAVHGTAFPVAPLAYGLQQLMVATSAVTRVPIVGLSRRGPARALFVQSARALSKVRSTGIGAAVGLSESEARGESRPDGLRAPSTQAVPTPTLRDSAPTNARKTHRLTPVSPARP